MFKYLSTSHSESSSSYGGAGAFIQAFDLNLKKNDFSHSQTQSAPHSSSQSSSSSSFLGNPGAGTYWITGCMMGITMVLALKGQSQGTFPFWHSQGVRYGFLSYERSSSL